MKIDSTSITNENAGVLLALGAEAIASGDLAVDLSAVATVDTAAIALLLDWQRQAQSRGGRLLLQRVPADVASLARLYGVAELLGIEGTGGA